MSHIELRCPRCGKSRPADMSAEVCLDCGLPLDVAYITHDETGLAADVNAIPSPIHEPGSMVSLGEGNTPCVKLLTIGGRLPLSQLFAKLEFLNPTGSFKDRGTATMVSVAREHGVTELVEDSSGNAGASVSAYAARAGIKSHIFVPADAPEAKLRQIRAYGTEIHPIAGTREAVTSAAVAFHQQHGLVYASHMLSPYFAEGTKAFGYEVVQQFVVQQLNGAMPDHVVFPVGNGSLLIGAFQGFRELQASGIIDKIPRLHAVQARNVMPLVAAFNNETWSLADATKTVAGGISVAAPSRQWQILEILRLTAGSAVAVDESSILRMQRDLAEQEGIFAEPTSAAAFAGLEELASQGVIQESDTVLVPVTGFGLKDEPPR
ncbi:MAG: threonine synthase [SAR202 cluster bacterium]|nr:threonine synthase [SAR202 cluster bacterium]